MLISKSSFYNQDALRCHVSPRTAECDFWYVQAKETSLITITYLVISGKTGSKKNMARHKRTMHGEFKKQGASTSTHTERVPQSMSV